MLLLFIGLVLTFVNSLSNPGMLFTVPLPLTPPLPMLQLPLSIAPIVITGLQLTNSYLREINYKVQIGVNITTVSSSHLITFDWSFKEETGLGHFQEEEAIFTLANKFTVDSTMHFSLKTEQSVLKPGHVKIVLGGNVKESIRVEVINLIANHAAIVYRKTLANAIGAIVQSAAHSQDIRFQLSPQQILIINTSLVALPFFSSNTLILPIDARVYTPSTPALPLNPLEVLQKTNSTLPQLQIHSKLLQKIIQEVIESSWAERNISTTNISSVVDINSYTLSSVFPELGRIRPIRDVVMDVRLSQLSQEESGNSVTVIYKGIVTVSSASLPWSNQLYPYLRPANVTVTTQIVPVFGPTSLSFRLQRLQFSTIQFDQKDIQANLIHPQQLTKYISVLQQWITDAVNFDLNKAITKLALFSRPVPFIQTSIKDYGYSFEFILPKNTYQSFVYLSTK